MNRPKKLVVPADQPTLAAWVTPREHTVILAHLSDRVLLQRIRDLSEIVQSFSAARAHGAIASAALLDAASAAQLGRLHRAFPYLPVVGLISEEAVEPVISRAVMLARVGADPVVDLRTGKQGWSTFHGAMDRLPTPVVLSATKLVKEVLGSGATDGWLRFIATAFRGDRVMVRDIALQGGIKPGVFASRFARAKLPTPAQYLDIGFVARFAYLAETTTWSVSAIANAIDASSSQALGRLFKRLTGLTAVQWRQEHGLASVLTDFSARFIEPHLATLRHFDPFQGTRECAESSLPLMTRIRPRLNSASVAATSSCLPIA